MRALAISATMRTVDIWTAILLLTGQLTVSGVFLASGAMWFSLTGPILAYISSEGKTPHANALLDGIDIITALLLILGQITNIGPWRLLLLVYSASIRRCVDITIQSQAQKGPMDDSTCGLSEKLSPLFIPLSFCK
ncbi:hypothetical protein [Alicyclobacillus dauci]|uniref:Uncharacterized protein n=1 Tax=Alicyclobacillus dauci TaxID=1475485 RepID=A0ABY6Z435_9BACL|nr:hypothetical protein [Alicyclobacillus dauci]WAH36956.1 hypothetical protein NZD86_22815 [Alicyclobacillus dauci]